MQKVLITGASGFVGSHITEEALARNLKTYAAIRATSSRRYLQAPAIQFFPFDMAHEDQLARDLAAFADNEGGFDYVIHSAGITKPRKIDMFHEGNAEFTRRFAEMLISTQPNLKKFIYIGSLAALGPGVPGAGPVTEDQTPAPLTPYGRSKLAGMQLLQELTNLPHITIMPASVYGPRDIKFSLRMIKILRRGIEVRLGPAHQKLSFIYVDDLARLCVDACHSEIRQGAYLAADGKYYSQKEFNQYFKNSLRVNTMAIRLPAWLLVSVTFGITKIKELFSRPVHLSHHKMREITAENWHVSIDKVRSELGFEPQFDLEKGIEETVKWANDK